MFRLLELKVEDVRLALAAGETLLRSRFAGIAPDTLYLWEGQDSVLFSGELEDWARINVIKEMGLQALRVNSVENRAVYIDDGTLNFTIATKKDLIEQTQPDRTPVLSEYQTIFECVTAGLEELGLKARADPKGIYLNTGKIAFGFPYWLSNDFLLFRGCVFVNTELETAERVMITKNRLTSISKESGKIIDSGTARSVITNGFEKKLGVKLTPQPLLEREEQLMLKLHQVKYSATEWNEKGKEPHLAMLGEKLVEVYVANPPTYKCRELMALVKDVVSRAKEIKMLVWLRGAGEDQNPGEIYSPGLTYVSKAGLLPAVVVNGKVMFTREIPKKEDLEKAILGEQFDQKS